MRLAPGMMPWVRLTYNWMNDDWNKLPVAMPGYRKNVSVLCRGKCRSERRRFDSVMIFSTKDPDVVTQKSLISAKKKKSVEF